MHCSQLKSTKCEIFIWNCNILGTTYHRDSTPHWIWHTSNLKYAPLKPFQCIVPSQNQQNVKFMPEIVFFFRNHLSQRLKTCSIGFGMPQTLNMHHSSHFNAFSQSKSTKCEIFCLKLWFFMNHLLYFFWHTSNPKYAPLKEPLITETQENVIFFAYCDFFRNHLSQRHENLQYWIWHASDPTYVLLKPFQSIFSSQNQQMWIFHCFLNSPWQKTENNINFHRERVFHKDLQICTYRVSGYANCNALCYNFVWQVLFELLWFFCICYGKVKI